MSSINEIIKDFPLSIIKSTNTRLVRTIVNFLMSLYVLVAIPWWTGEKGYKNLMSVANWCGLPQISRGIEQIFAVLCQDQYHNFITVVAFFALLIPLFVVVRLYAQTNVTNFLPPAVLTSSFILSLLADITNWGYFQTILPVLVLTIIFILVWRLRISEENGREKVVDGLWSILLPLFAFVLSYFYCVISPVCLLMAEINVAGITVQTDQQQPKAE